VLCHRDGRNAHVEAFDDLSLKTRERQLVRASREGEAGDYVCANALKAEIEISRFAWVLSSQRQGNGEEVAY